MGESSRILVVDDEENLRNILEFQLRGEGFDVQGVGRGDETLPTVMDWKPDLVLLDLMMPGMDGFSVCRQLRGNESTQRLPIIVVTARGDAATRLQALVAGAHEFVVKPYSWEELLTRIQNVLELAQRHAGAVSSLGFPGSAATDAEIQHLIAESRDFAFVSIDIDSFRRFNERFGYDKGDEIVGALGQMILHTLDERPTEVRFVGHVGSDDFVVLVDPDAARPIADALTERFDARCRHLFSEREMLRGHYEVVNRRGERESVPLVSLTIAIVNNVAEREMHPRRVSDIAAELRLYGKSRPGSIVVTERRR